jgi:hypothetical protein
MKRYTWMLAAPMIASLALPALAQTTATAPRLMFTNDDPGIIPAQHFRRVQPPCPCPPGQMLPTTPIDPSKTPVNPKTPIPEPSPTPTPQTDNVPSFGGYKSAFGQGTPVSAGTGIGGAVASAAAGLPIPQANAHSATLTTNSTPLIMPSLLTAATSWSATPLDRVFFDYGYFNRFAIASPTGPTPGFNLNQFRIGAEKTVLDGNASVYVSVPFLYATSNISGQAIDGLGAVNAGFKFALWQNRETGSIISAGLTVAAPTARATTVTNTLNVTFTGGTQPSVVPNPPPVGTVLPFTISTTINPTYLQPFGAGLWVVDRFFLHEYFGVLVPTDDRVSTIINNNITMGYNIYESRDGFVSSFTPVLGLQMLLPVNHINNSAGSTTSTVPANIPCIGPYPLNQLPNLDSFGFPTQMFLSAGAQIGIGERCLLNANIVVPVVGPRGYQVGATVGLSYLY